MRLIDGILATLVVALWGINFVAAKFGMQHFPPFFLTAMRFTLVAAMLVPFFPRPGKAALFRIFQLSLSLGTLHFALLFGALYHGLDISTCTILTQLGTPFTCALGAFFFKDRLGIWRISGILISFIGIMLVVGTPNIASNQLGFWLAICGAFAWGVSNILMKRIEPMSIFSLLGWMALFAVPMLMVLSLVFEHPSIELIKTTPWPPVLGLLYTVFCSTLVAYGIWYRLLLRFDVSQVAPFALLTPVFGIGAAQVFFHEELTWHLLVGGLVTMIGVGIIVIRRPKTAEQGIAT